LEDLEERDSFSLFLFPGTAGTTGKALIGDDAEGTPMTPKLRTTLFWV
jgi:hypothetical protein